LWEVRPNRVNKEIGLANKGVKWHLFPHFPRRER
jgi:hypothetical protein